MVSPTGKRERRYCSRCKVEHSHRRCNESNGWYCLSCFQFHADPPPPLAWVIAALVVLAIIGMAVFFISG